jgi:hypothetical protein
MPLAVCKKTFYHEGPSAAEPQPNRQEDVHHEGHENHEVRSLKYPNPFVSFVNFVVRPYFLIEHSNIGTVARKFAQAAKLLKHSSTRFFPDYAGKKRFAYRRTAGFV